MAIVFGGASLSGEAGGYGFGKIEAPEALLEYAFERGIEYYDTAPVYGFSESEKTLGEFSTGRREKVKFVSKSGVSWHNTKRINMTNDPKVTLSMLEQSLKDLRSDYIDVYMIHWPDKKVDIRFPMEVLAKAQLQGKIHKVGLCNTTKEDITFANEVANIEVIQAECNLFNNHFESLELNNETTMGWGTLDKGILAKSVTKDRIFSKEDARSWALWWKKSNWKEKVEAVKSLEERFKLNIFETALAYSKGHVDLSIVGMKTKSHVDSILETYEQDKQLDWDEIISYVRNLC